MKFWSGYKVTAETDQIKGCHSRYVIFDKTKTVLLNSIMTLNVNNKIYFISSTVNFIVWLDYDKTKIIT